MTDTTRLGVPYTYLVRHKPTGLYYYGLQYGKNCHPQNLWKTYFTSSKDIHKLIESTGADSFEYTIRRTFDNATDAIEWEKKVLRRMNVVSRSDFVNRNIPGSSMFAHSEETKEKMRKPKPEKFRKQLLGNQRAKKLLGRPKSDEHRKNISKSKQGKKNPMYGRKGKLSPAYGRKKSLEEIEKVAKILRNRIWMNNGMYAIFVPKEEEVLHASNGYVLGRGSSKFHKPPKEL